MAEALGLAAGIAGLLSLTIETYRISAKYINGVRNASKLVKDLLRELDALKKVLVDLDGLIAEVDEDVVSYLCLSNSIEHRFWHLSP
jgi:Fungal N-terminal domain of STAND proteins